MSCVLRASGPSFDVDAFRRTTSLPVLASHKTGDRRPVGPSSYGPSGLNVRVSDADFGDFEGQIREALAFLDVHASEVARLLRFPGVEGATLDFGIGRRDVAAQTDAFPPAVVSRAGALGLGITISHYEIGSD